MSLPVLQTISFSSRRLNFSSKEVYQQALHLFNSKVSHVKQDAKMQEKLPGLCTNGPMKATNAAMLFLAGGKAAALIQGEESRHACGASAEFHGSSCLLKLKPCKGTSWSVNTEAGVVALGCFSMNGSIKHLLKRLQGKKGHSMDAKRGRRRRLI